MPWEKQFDEREALFKAGETFHKNGYEATSLVDLLGAMGIQKGSFYATFGSKRQVLLDSLNAYIERFKAHLGPLLMEDDSLAALENHLDMVIAQTTGNCACDGCYLVNMSLEVAPKDEGVQEIVQKSLAGHERFYRQLIQNAIDQGRLAKDLDATATASALLGMVIGMRTLGRAGATKSLIERIGQQAKQLLVRVT